MRRDDEINAGIDGAGWQRDAPAVFTQNMQKTRHIYTQNSRSRCKNTGKVGPSGIRRYSAQVRLRRDCVSKDLKTGHTTKAKFMSSNNGASVVNGRTAGGRFGPGNKVAAGTRQAHLQQLRKAFLDCLTVSDVADVTAALVTAAKGGDIAAIKVFFDRVHGRVATDVQVDEDEPDLSDDERREQLLNRFSRLSPEVQDQVRKKLKKPTTIAE